MKAILHLGDQKAGSKSIQNFLKENDKNLQKENVLNSKCTKLGGYDAGLRALSGQAGWAEQFSKRKRFDNGSYEAIKSYVNRELKSEMGTTSASVMVFSFEGLLGMPHKEKESLIVFLHRYFEEIDAVAFLRRNDRKVRSGYATRIQNEGIVDRDIFFGKNGAARGPRYLSDIEKWSELLGKDSFHAINFDQSNDVVGDFVELLGLEGPFHHGPERKNVAPTACALEVMLRFNEKMAVLEPYCQKPIAIRREIRQILKEGGRFMPARRRAVKHYEIFKEENIRLGEELLGVEEDFFDNDFSEYPQEEEAVHISDDEFLKHVNMAARNSGLEM